MGTVKDKENAKTLQKRNDLCYQSRKRAIIYTELILSVSTGEVQKTENVHTNGIPASHDGLQCTKFRTIFGMETMLDNKYKIIHPSY